MSGMGRGRGHGGKPEFDQNAYYAAYGRAPQQQQPYGSPHQGYPSAQHGGGYPPQGYPPHAQGGYPPQPHHQQHFPGSHPGVGPDGQPPQHHHHAAYGAPQHHHHQHHHHHQAHAYAQQYYGGGHQHHHHQHYPPSGYGGGGYHHHHHHHHHGGGGGYRGGRGRGRGATGEKRTRPEMEPGPNVDPNGSDHVMSYVHSMIYEHLKEAANNAGSDDASNKSVYSEMVKNVLEPLPPKVEVSRAQREQSRRAGSRSLSRQPTEDLKAASASGSGSGQQVPATLAAVAQLGSASTSPTSRAPPPPPAALTKAPTATNPTTAEAKPTITAVTSSPSSASAAASATPAPADKKNVPSPSAASAPTWKDVTGDDAAEPSPSKPDLIAEPVDDDLADHVILGVEPNKLALLHFVILPKNADIRMISQLGTLGPEHAATLVEKMYECAQRVVEKFLGYQTATDFLSKSAGRFMFPKPTMRWAGETECHALEHIYAAHGKLSFRLGYMLTPAIKSNDVLVLHVLSADLMYADVAQWNAITQPAHFLRPDANLMTMLTQSSVSDADFVAATRSLRARRCACPHCKNQFEDLSTTRKHWMRECLMTVLASNTPWW